MILTDFFSLPPFCSPDVINDPSFTQSDKEESSDDEDDDSSPPLPKNFCFGGKEVEKEQIQKALDYYRSSDAGSRPLASMSSRFRWIKTSGHLDTLRRIEKRG